MSVKVAVAEAANGGVKSPVSFTENEIPNPIIEQKENNNNKIKLNHPKDNWEVAVSTVSRVYLLTKRFV